jgi:hypothetical protein
VTEDVLARLKQTPQDRYWPEREPGSRRGAAAHLAYHIHCGLPHESKRRFMGLRRLLLLALACAALSGCALAGVGSGPPPSPAYEEGAVGHTLICRIGFVRPSWCSRSVLRWSRPLAEPNNGGNHDEN